MTYLRNFARLSFAMALILVAFSSDKFALSAELETKELKTSESSLDTVERSSLQTPRQDIRPAAAGMHIEAVPAFCAGKSAWITVLDANDRPATNVSVLVNGVAQNTDENGVAAFRVPNAAALALTLVDENKKEVHRRNYELMLGGLLVAANADAALKTLLTQNSAMGRLPVLTYAPAVLEPSKQFVLLGANIATGNNGKVMLDGDLLPVFSSSPVAVLARVPGNALIGPLKQIYVTGQDAISSNVLEVDVARSEVSFDKDNANETGDVDARLAVYGTNLPLVLTITDEHPGAALLSLADGTKLGERSCVLAPGGDQNVLPARMQIKLNGVPAFRTSLQSDGLAANLFASEYSGASALSVSPSLWLSMYEAQLVKLKRRLVALQSRISETKSEIEKLNGAADKKPAEIDRLVGNLKAFSLREDALSVAIAARKRIFIAAGNSEDRFNRLMDDATGGAYYAIEAGAHDVEMLSKRNPVLANSLPPVEKPRMSRRLLRALAEPRIKLLPPLDMDDSAIGTAPLSRPNDTAAAAREVVETEQVKPGSRHQPQTSVSVPPPAKSDSAAKDKANPPPGTKKTAAGKKQASDNKSRTVDNKHSQKGKRSKLTRSVEAEPVSKKTRRSRRRAIESVQTQPASPHRHRRRRH